MSDRDGQLIFEAYQLITETFNFQREDGKTYWANSFTWPQILDIAEKYGWTPQGTVKGEFPFPKALYDTQEELDEAIKEWETDNWEGGYNSNDFQVILAADAKALAEALKKVLADLSPNAPSREKQTLNKPTPKGKNWQDQLFGPSKSNVFETFGGTAGRKYLTDLIAFLEQGQDIRIS